MKRLSISFTILLGIVIFFLPGLQVFDLPTAKVYANEEPSPAAPTPSDGQALQGNDTSTPTETQTTTPTETPTGSPTATPSETPTATATETPTLTPYTPRPIFAPFIARQEQPSPTPTETPTPTPTPTNTPTPTPTNTPDPDATPVHLLFCTAPYASIPDDDAGGYSSLIGIPDSRYLVDLEVRLDITHPWVGDLSVTLTHEDTGQQITLVNRPGHPNSNTGCGNPNIKAILDSNLSLPVEEQCSTAPAAVSGIFLPQDSLDVFRSESLAGSWTLNVADHYRNDTGQLVEWCLAASVYDTPLDPTPTPEIPSLPDQVMLYPTGQGQALPLDCESRSAVDWANYLGVAINEFDFFYGLPLTDNPDTGFVGNVYGVWGQIPPNAYGVHAEPIAARLRAYGLPAYAHRPLSFDALRAEIYYGRPVIVWIVGDHTYPITHLLDLEIPYYYRSLDDHLSIVAHYEHTVVATGYTPDTVYYLDGASIYAISRDRFLQSWSAMGNMAVTALP